jgi:hypothetical protein
MAVLIRSGGSQTHHNRDTHHRPRRSPHYSILLPALARAAGVPKNLKMLHWSTKMRVKSETTSPGALRV